MCGICGIVYRDRSRPVGRDLIGAALDALAHRGPDDHGVFAAPGIGLGSRRLAILDLSPRGHMPMQTPDGRYVITYNGEVYNYRDLRKTLVSDGVAVRSDGDTEIVLRLFERHGAAMLPMLNGMFAFAIWDTVDRSLFVARDRLGVKPLYYSESDEGLFFASEEKALFALGCSPEFDRAVFPELLCFKYTAGERTPFLGVRRVLPGHSLQWRGDRVETRRWWHLGERAAAIKESPMPDAAAWFRETFDDSVDLRRISDVPLGVLLSAGLDSTSVAASLARHEAASIASFTVRFGEAGFDEGPAAKASATRLGLSHHELEVGPAALESLLDRATWLNDEPIGHGSDPHLLAIAEFAKPSVTVLLSGEGADETLSGYERYRPLRFANALLAGGGLARLALRFEPRGRVRKLARLMSAPDADACVDWNACEVHPHDLPRVGLPSEASVPYRSQVLAEAQQLYPADLSRQALYFDMHTYLVSLLHRNDRMTMGASIECRVPFLDYRLVEGLAALPSSVLLSERRGKPLLRKAIGDRLPEDLRTRRKWGFGVPWHQYLRTQDVFRQRVESLARDEWLLDAGCDARRVASLVGRFRSGDATSDALVLQLFMFATWRRVYFSRAAALRPRAEVAVGVRTMTPAADAYQPVTPHRNGSRDVSVLLVGNFLSSIQGSYSVGDALAERLSQTGCSVVTTSGKTARWLRLMDMVGTTWRERHAYSVAQVDVFSGRAFVWAEAVCVALRLAQKPYVLTLHGGNLPSFARRHPARVERLLRSAAAVTTPSQFLLDQFAAMRPDVQFIPNGVELSAHRPRRPAEVRPRLIWLRAFHEVYNPSLAVRAVPFVAERYPDVTLTMIGADKGDGSLQAARRLAAELAVSDRVTFRNAVQKRDVPAVLAAGDIFLNTTNIDAAPVTVIEALASGLCVVSTDVGGIPYLVQQERNALLVRPDDPKAMADAVIRLVEDQPLAARLSCEGRRAAERFDWAPIIGEWRSLLASAAEPAA